MAEASLQPIYERLNGADSYHPFSASTFADWSIEAGDIVTLKRKSDAYVSPVHSSHLSWRGSPQVTMQSRGSRELDSIGKATQKKFNRSNGGYRAARTIGKKSSVFLQHGDPSTQINVELNLNDVWIDYAGLDTINDVGELSWDELADYTWMDFYGSKMYSWNGSSWVEISDQQKEEYNFELLQNTVTELRSVKGDLAGAFSEIKQTKSDINATIKDTKNGLEWNLNATAGLLRSEMTDSKNELQSAIQQEAGRISLVVEGTGNNAHIKPASIVAAINAQTGQSLVKLSADVIELDGDAVASSLTGKTINADTVNCDDIGAGTGLYFGADAAIHSYYGDSHDANDMIVKAAVSGNTLTLTPLTGNPITFSKATTLDVSSWSGSVLTVKAKQNNTDVATKTIGFGGSYGDHDIELSVSQNGTIAHSSGSTAIIPLKVAQLQGGGASNNRYTNNILVDTSSLLQSKTATSNGTVTPDSGYIGLSDVVVNVSGSSINPKTAISINNPTWYNSGSSMPSVDATLNTMGGLIAKNKQGYIYFNVTISGVSGNKVYRIPVSTI